MTATHGRPAGRRPPTAGRSGRRSDDRSPGGSGGRPPLPDPLPTPVTDTHTHLDLQGVDVEDAISAAGSVGVTTVIQVGIDAPSSVWAATLARRQAGVWATAAIHPNEAPRLVLGDPDGWSRGRREPGGPGALDAALADIDRLAALPEVCGIGETGLDYFRTGVDGRSIQHEAFRQHIRIAKRHQKTLVIHDRDAHEDVLKVLEAEGAPDRVVFHCFSGDAAMAQLCAERGYYLSFAGNITFGSAQPLREALAAAPLDRLLVETDAPFLTPVPYRGRPNASYLVPLTVRKMAEVTSIDLTTMAEALQANAARAFGRSVRA